MPEEATANDPAHVRAVVTRCAVCGFKVTAYEQRDGTRKWGHSVNPRTGQPMTTGRPGHEIVPYADSR